LLTNALASHRARLEVAVNTDDRPLSWSDFGRDRLCAAALAQVFASRLIFQAVVDLGHSLSLAPFSLTIDIANLTSVSDQGPDAIGAKAGLETKKPQARPTQSWILSQ
jgi:hypothetical protein